MITNEQTSTFSRISRVSRETILILEEFEKYLINANKTLNLIGKSTIEKIWSRHILDSYQVIDFIDKNDIKLTDIGSGAGFPGIVLAIVAKDRKLPLKIKLIEKSPKKTKFLETTIRKLKLDVEVSCINIFENEKNIDGDVFVARAFKRLSIILKLINNQTPNFKKFFIFLGKTGKEDLLEASKSWDIEYKQRMSITSSDSIIIEVNKLKKIN
jgi:16S rRNA (guanine527-N7)-methyltransferase